MINYNWWHDIATFSKIFTKDTKSHTNALRSKISSLSYPQKQQKP
jgi:hypothetical protein